MDDYQMRLPTASQGAVLYMRWRMGPASWLEWPWPGGHGPFLDTPKPDQLAEDRFRHPQIGQFAEDRFRHTQIGQFAEDRFRHTQIGQFAEDQKSVARTSFDIPKFRQVSQGRTGRHPSSGAPCGRTHGQGQGPGCGVVT